MSLVKDLYLLTKDLYDHVLRPLPKDIEEREKYIERIDDYLSKRTELLEKMSPENQFSEVEMTLGRELVKMNEVIEKQLEKSKSEMLRHINELKKKKEYSYQYDNPYGTPTVDGVFFDKKN